MLYHENGRLGKFSVMGLGCWNFGAQWNKTTEAEAINIIRTAIDNGVNLVDVAESYGYPDGQCEMILGKALKNGYRNKVFLISKVGWYGRREIDNMTARSGVIESLLKKIFNRLYRFKTVDLQKRTSDIVRLSGHACCGRLQTDHIDLLLCHDGNPQDMNPFIEGFRILKAEGFINHYGISTDDLSVLKRFYDSSEGECAACECDYSLLNRSAESGLFKFCREKNIAIFTRGTLSRGLLSGKYDLKTSFKEQSRIQWNVNGIARSQYEYYINQIGKIKELIGDVSLTETAYRFAFSNPIHPVVVFGCTDINQLDENIRIGESYLSSDIIEKLHLIS